jgi:hypothetical protein
MFSFEGDFKTRPKVSLGGASRKVRHQDHVNTDCHTSFLLYNNNNNNTFNLEAPFKTPKDTLHWDDILNCDNADSILGFYCVQSVLCFSAGGESFTVASHTRGAQEKRSNDKKAHAIHVLTMAIIQ